MATNTNPVIPKGSIVLVTGVNGFIASHVAEQFLIAGYKVRGTVRSLDKGKALEELFAKRYGAGKFELVVVEDLKVEGAFDEAIKGVSGIAHLASVLTWSSDPNVVIPPTIAGAVEILKSAMKEDSVKSFVFTSSSWSASMPRPNVEITITKDTWNEESSVIAWGDNPDGANVYGASKTEAEKAVVKFVKEKKPKFQVSSVLPSANIGEILPGQKASITAAWVPMLFKGGVAGEDSISDLLGFPPQYFVNVKDTARLHVAAMIDPTQNGNRIFAFTAPFNWNDVLAVMRKLYPNAKLIDDVPGMGRDLSIAPSGEAEELLKKHFGKGWVGLEETVRENLVGVA